MPRHDPSPDPRPEIAGVVALLREDRESLVARIAELSADMDALFEASRDSNADDEHDPEGQTIAYERSQLAAITAQTRDRLDEVEAALERVSDGIYGRWEVCGEPIPLARLEARPAARTCLRHAETRR